MDIHSAGNDVHRSTVDLSLMIFLSAVPALYDTEVWTGNVGRSMISLPNWVLALVSWVWYSADRSWSRGMDTGYARAAGRVHKGRRLGSKGRCTEYQGREWIVRVPPSVEPSSIVPDGTNYSTGMDLYSFVEVVDQLPLCK